MSDYQNLAIALEAVENSFSIVRKLAGQLAAENAALKEKHSNKKKLTLRDAERIREMYSRTSYSQRQLAEMFDVNHGTISRIVSGQYHKV